ncbi:Oidioi.mRNA.OKI2018_I69.XSR.g16548.t1.cds [Oikopleura dioica]|uniref:Oidioi.mRNA.OKI2018_I69.XSR.g16548.t1.cds n=1 Tax=Oikopleura dioica TaxID=34765 RepID=A0ABN7SKN9_OIKDI|nr:Oidioi.mRNA.OKI2018_I69.XSR.g16548.t1.cds [Oikopleura dioica]
MRIIPFALSALARAQDYFETTTIAMATGTTGFETTASTAGFETELPAETTARPNTFQTTEAGTAEPSTFDPLAGGRSLSSGISGRTGGGTVVNSLYDVQASLGYLADGTTPAFIFSWTYDSTHTNYAFTYQELAGNYANVTDYQPFSGNKVYRWQITPTVGAAYGSPSEVLAQSSTSTLVHQPGALYEGGGGFAGQILLPTDFTNANFVRVDSGAVGATAAADSLGYVIAVKVQFPAGCPSIRVDADVDPNFIYTDPSIADNHRIFVFPQTHFSNQFSGPIRAFHYYVSGANYAGCSFTDPAVDVTVSVDNSYIVETTEAAVIEPLAGWPSGSSYPPVEWTENRIVNLTDYIQPASHIGPSRAIAAPRIDLTVNCAVTFNVEAGVSPGWGFVNEYDGTLDITDLWANTPTSNTASAISLQALEWLTQVGIAYRVDIQSCPVVDVTGTITFLELNPASMLVKAVNP